MFEQFVLQYWIFMPSFFTCGYYFLTNVLEDVHKKRLQEPLAETRSKWFDFVIHDECQTCIFESHDRLVLLEL